MAPPMALLETYRDPHEPDEKWHLRRAFLRRNWDEFPSERRTRLLALAQCFQNIQVLGCSYPARVMEEVARLSVGLVEAKSKSRRLPFAKINFVKSASPGGGTMLALDVEEDDDDDGDEITAQTLNKTDQVDGPSRRFYTAVQMGKQSQAFRKSLADSDEDDDYESPRLGFGATAANLSDSDSWTMADFDGTSHTAAAPSTSKFIFGSTDCRSAKRLGFVSSTRPSTDGEFQFGVPFERGIGAKAEGDFVFGLKDLPMEDSDRKSSAPGAFKFGAEGKDYAAKLGFVKSGTAAERRKSDDLNRHMQSTSLQEGPTLKNPRWEGSIVTGFDSELQLLNDLKMQLRQVRPPLQQARVEFAMLQVCMAVTASGAKLEVINCQPTILKLYGIHIANGVDEPSAYENFIQKVFDSRPWNIVLRDERPTLEPGGPMASFVEAPPLSEVLSKHSRNEASTSQYRAGPPPENNRQVNSQIIRNLIEVRNTIWTPNFKSKAAMFGGPTANVQSALNMAFQLAKLKPIHDAVVPGTFLKPEFTNARQIVTCLLTFHGVVLVAADSRSKNEAKLAATKKLYEVLESQVKFEIIEKNGRSWLNTFGSSQQDRRAQMLPEKHVPIQASTRAEYRDLFLVRPTKPVDLQALITIFASANGLALNFVTDAMIKNGATVQICRLDLPTEPPLVFEGVGETKQIARRTCIRATLESLVRNCFTIDIKQSIVDGAQEFSKEAMPLGLESETVQNGLGRQLAEDNVGYRLLKNMGWRGGGLGQGTGLVEPVMLKDNTGGRGLGYEGTSSVSKRFKSHVASTLRVFLRETDVFDELKFSPSFSNVERKEIHTIARRLGLKSKSQNRPEGRVLCVSHNIDWRMILNRLKTTGPSGKYGLLPPNSWTPPES
ncbi:hypothetical protein BIW11_12058 [Tropilaelaps mercedesae]|uniref:NF-kappa-B-repressing factor-like n=1 Tax=Tropilaelaps mercedesae TaxID=418985 RepID=A0A1V9X899_9ACAR|nr:hypothetical protein BIW11_12058 [Tropilaelaps mercedesae]